MASLFVIRGRDQGRRFEMTGEVYSLGRDQSNSIQLHDTEISRRHAEISQGDRQHELLDLQSSNGTFVNNSRVRPARCCKAATGTDWPHALIYTAAPMKR